MHAFDLQKLQKGIEVRYARKGEKLLLLDGQTIELDDTTLVIADGAEPVAMAGIMGGELTAVHADTTDIFVESAFFTPTQIAGKARRYGLHTDSSHRFERGVSPDLQVRAIERATALLMAIVGGVPGPVVHVTQNQKMPTKSPIRLRKDRIERVLGANIAHTKVIDILHRLGMSLKENTEGWEVIPPAWRFDVAIEEDLIEEIGRVYGYNQLPLKRPQVDMAMNSQPESKLAIRRIKHALVDLGYQEAVTYSFVDPAIQAIIDPDCLPVPLANPISAEMGVMRTTLWSGLIQAMKYNLHRQQNRLLLFEYGLKFVQQDTVLNQELMLAGLITGSRDPEQWGMTTQKADFFDVKGHVEAILLLTGCFERFSFEATPHPVLHPGQSAAIKRDGGLVGWVGAIHPQVAKQLDLDHTMYLFEIKADSLQAGRVPKFQAVSRYPTIRRDLSIVVDLAITAQKVRETVQRVAPQTLQKVEMFDMYMGEGIDSGRKSLSLGLTLQDLSRTLTDSEVEEVMQRVITQLHNDLGATLRQ
jgi:phenylalanyl-tRNA synthetase beta chain